MCPANSKKTVSSRSKALPLSSPVRGAVVFSLMVGVAIAGSAGQVWEGGLRRLLGSVDVRGHGRPRLGSGFPASVRGKRVWRMGPQAFQILRLGLIEGGWYYASKRVAIPG